MNHLSSSSCEPIVPGKERLRKTLKVNKNRLLCKDNVLSLFIEESLPLREEINDLVIDLCMF